MGRHRKELDAPDAQIGELMLKSAAQLFNRKGYAATTVREIVAAVGVSKPVLYYYFGNKEGIYVELVRGPFAKFDAVLRECRQNGGSACERLLDLFSRTLALFLEHIEAVRIMYSLALRSAPRGAVLRFRVLSCEVLGDRARAHRGGSSNVGNSEELTRTTPRGPLSDP